MSVCLAVPRSPFFAFSFRLPSFPQTNEDNTSIKSVEEDMCLLFLVYAAHVPLDSLRACRIERLIPTFATLPPPFKHDNLLYLKLFCFSGVCVPCNFVSLLMVCFFNC